jgi:hypothetical protein
MGQSKDYKELDQYLIELGFIINKAGVEELLEYIHQSNLDSRIDELNDLRLEFRSLTWGPYDPDNIFQDRLEALKAEQADPEDSTLEESRYEMNRRWVTEQTLLAEQTKLNKGEK